MPSEPAARPKVVVKIGGSTLGRHDTTLADLVALQGQGVPLVVVHGGGSTITRWLEVHQVPTRFVRGLRATDAEALQVVVAVLAGLINKELVAALGALGGRAVGLCGADGGLIRARRHDPELGYVGQVEAVETALLQQLLAAGYLPVVAPVGALWEGGEARNQLLNINADTVAGDIAVALAARSLVFLTDVPGVRDGQGEIVHHLSTEGAVALMADGTIAGGMIPKVEACLRASGNGASAAIVDGREPHTLLAALRDEPVGTHMA